MAKSGNAIYKERIEKLKSALWQIANDLPVSAERFQKIAKSTLEYDKVVYSKNKQLD